MATSFRCRDRVVSTFQHRRSSADPSICGRWPGASTPSDLPLRRKVPCSAGWLNHRGYRELFGGCRGCYEECLPIWASCRSNQPRGCIWIASLRVHCPWSGETPCKLERRRAEMPRSAGRSTGQNSGTPAGDIEILDQLNSTKFFGWWSISLERNTFALKALWSNSKSFISELYNIQQWR